MKLSLQEYTTSTGETLLYTGTPDFNMMETLAGGPGDIWHSSFDQGLKNAFPEIAYQTATFFWYVRDFDLRQCVSWRINPEAFCVRKTVWETLGGFDAIFTNPLVAALDFGYNALRHQGAIPVYVKDLFPGTAAYPNPRLSIADRYAFFSRNFKKRHLWYMLYREGLWKPWAYSALLASVKKFPYRIKQEFVKVKELQPMSERPSVSYIIPTMARQDYTLQLLNDLRNQSYPPAQVVVVDATKPEERDESLYDPGNYPFRLDVQWQTTKGSCRARNEAIAVCTGDYIIFGDDDIRLPDDFIENHLRFLKTYGAKACAGLDIRADDYRHGLAELAQKRATYGKPAQLGGAAMTLSNSNACVRRDLVEKVEGNDINYDGGYGEDMDFGLSLVFEGEIVLQNPYSANLHLKPPAGGYRVWGNQAKVMGKTRKTQPWELDTPVKRIRPVPSPTVMYYFYKNFGPELVSEYRAKYFFRYLFQGSKAGLPKRLLRYPYRSLQFDRSEFYARKLMALGKRTK